MELKAGDAIPAVIFPPITIEQLRAYAEASGDPNLIHLDEGAAKKFGLPGIIAHGMLSAAFIAERALRFAAENALSSWKLHGLKTRFKAMTFLNEVISVGGSVKSLSDTEIVLDLEARNAAGDLKTSGLIRYRA